MDNNRVEEHNIRDGKGCFAKGYKHSDLPEEMRKKMHISQSEAWKSRKDYVGDLIKEAPYVYNSWRSIMFTQKGKKVGICETWRNFRDFYNDVRPSYKKGLVLRRKDVEKPFSVNNFIWCTTEDAGSLQQNTIYVEYKGEVLTLRQIAQKYNQSVSAVHQRYRKRIERGYTIDEIVFGRQKNRGSKRTKDVKEAGVNIRAKASKMISSYKVKDFKNKTDICDIDIDWMIENILAKNCVYCGDDKRIGCDRIDNSKGHTKDNVVPCCVECNTARNNNFTFEEMKILGETIRKIKHSRR